MTADRAAAIVAEAGLRATAEDEVLSREEEAAEALRLAVGSRKHQLRIDQLARAELAAEGTAALPPVWNGADFLAQPDAGPVYRIDGIWPLGGNIVLAAQFKAGKTTMVHSLLGSLCDGTRFLGRFSVTPPQGTVFMVDAEMPDRSARRWLREKMITRADRFSYVNIRGCASSFNMLLPGVRDLWAERIAAAGTGVLVLDCLGPVLSALGLDEGLQPDVGRFLGGLQALATDAGVTEIALVHHMGHMGERARGASRLRDWPDAEWRLVRQADDPASPRYFAAFGRDVDVTESRLEFDPATRALFIAGGSRSAERTAGAVGDILKAVDADPGINTRGLESALTDNGAHALHVARDAMRAALAAGYVRREDGPRRAKFHYLTPAGQAHLSGTPETS